MLKMRIKIKGGFEMKKKSLFAVLLFVIVLILSLSASAVKVNYKEFSSESTFKPVSYSSHKSVSSVTLYGNADYLCMKAFKDTKESQAFVLEVYSNSKRTKKILEYSNDYKKGTKYDDIFFDLTELKSKTYYATAYVEKKKNDGYEVRVKDPSTVTKFKIVVKRDGTKLKNMKTIMYGYENSVEGPIIYWYSVPGATKYYVYKKTDGKFKKIKTVKATGEDFSYYIDKSLKDKNATAYYKVKAVSGTGKTPLSADDLKVNAVKTPKVTLEYNTFGGIKLSWSKVSKNALYSIYVAKGDSDWQLCTITERTSFLHDVEMFALEDGNIYYFAVVAKTSKGVSGYENDNAVYFFINPEIKSIKENSGNFVISWNDTKGAESYNVYRKAKGDDGWTKIGNTKNPSFTDYNAERNTLYSYCVKSAVGSYECPYKAKEKEAAIFDVPVINSVKADSEGNPVISWSKIDGVSYRVSRKVEGESSWIKVGTSKTESFTDRAIKENGQKFSYAVNAYIDEVQGESSKASQSFIWYRPIRNAVPSPAEEGVGLNWEKAINIDSYNIYRKTADSEFALIGSSDTNYYNDKTADKDVRYTYKVVCVVGEEEKSITAGEISAELSSEHITIQNGSAETDDPLYCRVVIKDFDPSVQYTLYNKKEGKWVAVENILINDGKISFRKNTDTYINDYVIASVSSDGTVTSISEENVFTLEYIVPAEVTEQLDHQNYTATLSWKPVSGAEKYVVYLKGKQIAVLDSTKTSYKTGELQPEKFLVYSVGAVRGKTEIISYDCKVYIRKKPEVKAKTASDGIYIYWDSGYAADYTVYRKDSADGQWKAIGKAYNTYYTDKTAKNGKTYYYTVQNEVGAKDEKGVKIAFIKPVKISSITLGKKSIELKWKKSSAADYYIVQKKTDGKWKEVYRTKDAKTVKYTDKKVKAGKKYYYRVCVVKDGEKSEYTSKAVTFVAPPAGLKATAVSSGVKISFKKVEGAKKYVIYRKDGKGEYKKLKTLKNSSRSYTDKKIKKGTIYTYYVKAYNGSLYSTASSKVSYKK